MRPMNLTVEDMMAQMKEGQPGVEGAFEEDIPMDTDGMEQNLMLGLEDMGLEGGSVPLGMEDAFEMPEDPFAITEDPSGAAYGDMPVDDQSMFEEQMQDPETEIQAARQQYQQEGVELLDNSERIQQKVVEENKAQRNSGGY